MNKYTAPLRDMQFVLRELAPLDEVTELPGCDEATPDLTDAILEEAGRFAGGVLSPINASGDQEGARWQDGKVFTAGGWKEAYRRFVDGGWNALPRDPSHGGQRLPRLVSALVEEMWNAANTSFALCPMLTHSVVEALELCGSETLKQAYLPKMVSGEWTGTINLTEPEAGSDLSAVRTRAVLQPDGSYRVHGQKIFITYGEHDLSDNIVHLVLARTPDARGGVKGISLFVVPKFLVEAGGSLGWLNDVRCLSIERKLGMHASPTAVLAFGDNGGAIGWLVGEENHGLETMFIIMNEARFSVGLQGIGLAERAYQRALAYARERVQGGETGEGVKVPIIRHPDVRRMLMLMKSRIEALRAVACVVAAAMDRARCHADAAERSRSQAFVELMIPVVKGWSTESAIDIASLGVQIHGGMGFIEETGAAQHLRDACMTTIYEGTTGIQAADLIERKIANDGAVAIGSLIKQMREVLGQLTRADDERISELEAPLRAGVDAVEQAVRFIVGSYGSDPKKSLVGAVPFLELLGIVAGGWQMARAALISHRGLRDHAGDPSFLRAKLATARFYADHVLARAPGLAYALLHGATGAFAMEDDQF